MERVNVGKTQIKLDVDRSEVNHQPAFGGGRLNGRDGGRLIDLFADTRARKSGSFNERRCGSRRYGRFLISGVVAGGLMNTCGRPDAHINQCQSSYFPL